MNHRGYAIPLSLCVATVTLLLGLSAAQMSAGDLQVASREYYRERALQVAEYGLQLRLTSLDHDEEASTEFTNTWRARRLSADRVEVVVYDNRTGTLGSDSGCPVKVPVGFQYWVARGQTFEGNRSVAEARLGALVQWGEPVGAGGAQIRQLSVSNPGITPSGRPAPAPIHFAAVEGGPALPFVHQDEILCSTLAVTRDSVPLPGGSPADQAPVNLGSVGQFSGKVRIPVAAQVDVVESQRVLPPLPPGLPGPPGSGDITIDQTGGRLNIPEYVPPDLATRTATLTAGGTVELASGHYETLSIPDDTTVLFSGGDYHFGTLEVGNDVTIKNMGDHYSQVFVDNFPANRPVTVGNLHPEARAFRLYLKPSNEYASNEYMPESHPAKILKMTEAGGRLSVIAPGHRLQLVSSPGAEPPPAPPPPPPALPPAPGRLIQGSFLCHRLDLFYPTAGFPVPGRFHYDITASQARRTREMNRLLGDGFRPRSQFEPMILSRQPL